MRTVQTYNAMAARGLVLATIVFGATGCTAIKDIFKAGVWVGVIGIGALVLVIVGVMAMFKSK